MRQLMTDGLAACGHGSDNGPRIEQLHEEDRLEAFADRLGKELSGLVQNLTLLSQIGNPTAAVSRHDVSLRQCASVELAAGQDLSSSGLVMCAQGSNGRHMNGSGPCLFLLPLVN